MPKQMFFKYTCVQELVKVCHRIFHSNRNEGATYERDVQREGEREALEIRRIHSTITNMNLRSVGFGMAKMIPYNH